MTPGEARDIAARLELASARIVAAWTKNVKHPEVAFVMTASCCCLLLEMICEEDRERFGHALIGDLQVALGEWPGTVQ